MSGPPAGASLRRRRLEWWPQLMRFAGVGAANTLTTATLFYLLSSWLPSLAAFTIVYLAGLAFVALVVPRAVFRVQVRISDRLRLTLWYLVVYAIGLGIVAMLEDVLVLSREAVVLGTVAVTAPLGFVGSRALCHRASASGHS